MCYLLSITIGLFALTSIYHLFAGPVPGALHLVRPRITTRIHQQFVTPFIVQDPFNRSKFIEIAQTDQGAVYEKASAFKRYFWRTFVIRPCEEEGCIKKKNPSY